MCSLKSKPGIIIAFVLIMAMPTYAGDQKNGAVQPFRWPNKPPANCPHPRSKEISEIRFTGRWANYTDADTWYLAWAKDGNCYSCWTDGKIYGYRCASNPWHGKNVKDQCTGQARISGDDPLNLKITNLGKMYGDWDFCHPCVSVIADGVFYIGWQRTKNLESLKGKPRSSPGDPRGLYYDGVRYSTNWNHFTEELKPNWTNNPYWTDASDPDRNFFNETDQLAKFRYPHAVYFGQDNSLSPDGKIYFTSHGYAGGAGMVTWSKGDGIYLCRVDSKIKDVINPDAYQFWDGNEWVGKVQESKPILEWDNHLGSESITFIPKLNKYILMSARLKENEKNLDYNLLLFYEADAITGPYRLVHSMRNFGPQCYFPHIPPKFISKDGTKAWLCYSANYSQGRKNPNPKGSRYAMCLQEIEFVIANAEHKDPRNLEQ